MEVHVKNNCGNNTILLKYENLNLIQILTYRKFH